MRAYVILQPQYMGRVCGLCGNFDKVGDNDFRASTGELETTALAFANSWYVLLMFSFIWKQNIKSHVKSTAQLRAVTGN